MAPTSAGLRRPSLKRSRRKTGTASTNKHRFEPFSQRIAKLKIDPIRRIQRSDLDEVENETSSTLFRKALEKWMGLNLSENFTNFSRTARPLCDTLVQILHHEDRIMDLLAEYIEKRDAVSLEPLLDILTSFVADIGQRFEKHFSRTVTLVASVAATHPDVEVIEWSFTCLAYIFKSLSRLLVPDLPPTLAIISPYLGKERQKEFVTRFAAESISFLIKKAGARYLKDKEPLGKAVSFLYQDLELLSSTTTWPSYQYGLMTMFAEATRGVNFGIHSAGTNIIQCMLDVATQQDAVTYKLAQEVITGTIINLIHHTNSTTFRPILDVVLDYAQSVIDKPNKDSSRFATRLLFLLMATRKGSRVQNWKRVNETLLLILKLSISDSVNVESVPEMLATAAVALQTSPMDELLPYMYRFMDVIASDKHQAHFLGFCDLWSEFGLERFDSIVLSYFQKFILSHWSSNEHGLIQVINRLHLKRQTDMGSTALINIPPAWEEQIVERFQKSFTNDIDLVDMFAYTILIEHSTLNNDSAQKILQSLRESIDVFFSARPPVEEASCRLLAGKGLRTYVSLCKRMEIKDDSLWPLLCSSGVHVIKLPDFLEGLQDYIQTCQPAESSPETIRSLCLGLMENLSTPSHTLRLLSLSNLRLLTARSFDLPLELDLLDTAIEIESSSIDLQTVRTISMNIRRLAANYSQTSSSTLDRAIPRYLFGLLSVKSAQIWEDACSAIQSICDSSTAEQIVSEISFQWLHEPASQVSAAEHTDAPRQAVRDINEFQCSNVRMLDELIERASDHTLSASLIYKTAFEDAASLQTLTLPYARSQALRVLNAVPRIAERRSRQIVPLFLSWASLDDETIGSVETSTKSSLTITPEEPTNRWNSADRKALLNVFGQFQNPRVLYKSTEVYESLLECLTNGDKDIQGSALKAIFTWRNPSVQRYEINLTNLLDDARFRDELSTFMDGAEESSTAKDDRQDILPLLLRLLYGKLVSRKGSHSNQGGQETKRKAVLRALDRLPDKDFEFFIRIAFGNLADLHLVVDDKANEQCLAHEFLSRRKQYGLLKMVESMLETLGNRLVPFSGHLMNAVLYCLIRASRALATDATATAVEENSQTALLRNIRQVGVRCLDLVFSHCGDRDWGPFVPLIFTEVINPRIENFAVETSQGISGLLRLFGTWASAPKTTLYLAESGTSLITKIVDCLEVKAAQEEVKLFVLDHILAEVLAAVSPTSKSQTDDDTQDQIRRRVLLPNVDHILTRLASVLSGSATRVLLGSAVQVLSDISPFTSSSIEAEKLISIILSVVQQPSERVNPRTKGGLFRTVSHLLPLIGSDSFRLRLAVYKAVSASFDYFRDRQNRETLCSVLSVMALNDTEILEVSTLCASFNSYSSKQLDDVDYETRLAAFRSVNEEQWKFLTSIQWRPVLSNLLYFVKDEEEMAMRSSASFGLRRFIERAMTERTSPQTGFQDLVEKVLVPALHRGVKQKAELVRAEYVSVLGYFVKCFPDSEELRDLHPLLVNDDEEASFFNNILHIQQHRRQRALRRLADQANQGKIRSKNIAHIFIPLVEHFVFDTDEENANNLTSESIYTIGVLAQWLDWNQFRALFRRYKGYMEGKPAQEKTMIKLMGSVADALYDTSNHPLSNLENPDGETRPNPDRAELTNTLSKSIPTKDPLANELKTNFIPFLANFIHNKEESEISLRIPVAITTVKLIKLLPSDLIPLFLPSVLLDVASILRSKSQDSRDTARKTLADITMILGPSYFGFVLKELRTALPRGTQLHVLSYTVHSLLVATADTFKPGDLDYCLPGIVSVIIEDTFGAIGQEKDAEDYHSKMREVKSNKSYDSMELIAKHTTASHLHVLVSPVQKILGEKLNSGIVKKVDELLRRVGVGLLRNENAESRDLLVFCYEVMKERYRKGREYESGFSRKREEEKRFLVQSTSASKSTARGNTTMYSFKLTRFALDIVRALLHKHNSLLTPANVSGFLPMIGDALLESQEEVKISALRLTSVIFRVPLPEIDLAATTYIAEAMNVIKNSLDTNNEASQAALKVITAALKERKGFHVRESDISYLLKRLKTDLEEPDRQGVTFNFLKAVITRKIVVAEIYDLMDTVAAMMITNHNQGARDLARGTYFNFLMNYPQGQKRWTKQLAFMIKNMTYEHEEGRKSVLEAINLLLSKVGDNLVQDIVGAAFVPVLMAVANDDSPDCREMAAGLLKELFIRADQEHSQSFLSLLRSWVDESENTSLLILGLQAYQIFFDAVGIQGEDELSYVSTRIQAIAKSGSKAPSDSPWEPLFFALQLFTKISHLFPRLIMASSYGPLWKNVWACLSFPHAWVKGSAAGLLGIFLADIAKANAVSGYGSLPLTGSGDLRFDANSMLETSRTSLRVLQTPNVSEELATQSVRNLVFLGRCLALNMLKMVARSSVEDIEASDEDSDVDHNQQAEQRTVLQYLFERVSAILRKEPITTRAASLISKTAALRLLASLCSHIDEGTLRSSLPTILLPLQLLTDPSIPAPRSTDEQFQMTQKALVTSSQEVLDLLQKKLGTTEYIKQTAKVKEGIKERREGRRVKRRIEVVANPEKAGRDKKRKNERKKERRREIGAEERSRRHTRD